MRKVRNSNLLLVLAMAFVAMFSCLFGVATMKVSTQVSAETTIDYTELLGLEDRTSWASNHSNEVVFGAIHVNDNSYFKTAGGDCWYYGNDALITKNNGVDIMQYIYLNGKSARDLLIENQVNQKALQGGSGWLTNPAAWPITVQTAGDVWIRIDKTYFDGEFTFTFKPGFSLIRNDGAVITISEDITYVYKNSVLAKVEQYSLSFMDENNSLISTKKVTGGDAIGTLPEIPAKDGFTGAWTIDGVEITADTVYSYGVSKTAVITYTKISQKIDVTDSVNMEFNYSNSTQSMFKIFILPNASLTSNNAWNIEGWDKVLTAKNNGVDIMNYIYVNGQNIRELSDNNRKNNTYPLGSATGWLGNSDQCRPVFVETNGEGIWVTVLHSFSTENYTVTLKAGFEILNKDGDVAMITEDVEFICTAGGGVQRVVYCDLAFEGTDVVKTVKAGFAIGELPAIPAKDGYVGFWAIDGKPINANSVIAENKTAKVVYAIEYDSILALEDRTSWNAHEGEYSFGGIAYTGGYFNTAAAVNNAWYVGNTAPIDGNNGVDIMEYIYVNGVSARKLISDNVNGAAQGNSCGCWLSNPYAYPVYVETTAGDGMIIKVAKAYAGDSLTITFKAGFSIIRNDGQLVYVSNDINYTYANGVLTDESRFSVLFDGANVQYVRKGGTIVAPAEPTKEATESHTYVFDGWYNGDTKWDFSAPVESNMALVAKFNEVEKEKFAVTFNADNGTDSTAVSVYVGASVKTEQIPANPVKATDDNLSYTFLYWSVNGETAYDFATPVTGAITLTAIYTTKPLYSVTMGETTAKVVEGGKVEKPADPTKDATAEFNYTFDAWYNGETKWDFENDVVTSDLVLTAKFIETKRSYTITFNVTGNDAVSFEAVTLEYGASYDLSTLLDGIDVSAYTYSVTVNGEAVTMVEVLSDVTVDVTFVARVYYTVSIDGAEQTVEEGEKAVMPETVPTKASTAEFNYTFDGWYNGETKWDFENDVVTSDLVLTAKFNESKRSYTITFNVTGNDAITLDAVTVEYGTVYSLAELLAGKDVSGYSYSISVGGVEKTSFKVIGDTTVDVAFTAKPVANKPANGCAGTVTSAGALICAMALGAAVVFKKKED